MRPRRKEACTRCGSRSDGCGEHYKCFDARDPLLARQRGSGFSEKGAALNGPSVVNYCVAFPVAAKSLSPPRCAEQESDADRQCKGGIGPFPQGFVDRIGHIVADLAHRVHSFLPFGAGIGHHPLDVGSCANPSRSAFGGDDVGIWSVRP